MRIIVLRFCLFEKLLFYLCWCFLEGGACPATWLQLLPRVTSDFKAVDRGDAISSTLICLESCYVTSETSSKSSQKLCPVVRGCLSHTQPGLDGQTLPQLSCDPGEGMGDRYSHS